MYHSLQTKLLQAKQKEDDSHQLLSPSPFLSTTVLPSLSLQPTPPPPLSLDFALKLLIGCLDAALCNKHFDWLWQEVYAAVMVACCAGVLEECVDLVGEAVDTDTSVQRKTLTLNALDKLLKVFDEGDYRLPGVCTLNAANFVKACKMCNTVKALV
jgi:hypothetical protein